LETASQSRCLKHHMLCKVSRGLKKMLPHDIAKCNSVPAQGVIGNSAGNAILQTPAAGLAQVDHRQTIDALATNSPMLKTRGARAVDDTLPSFPNIRSGSLLAQMHAPTICSDRIACICTSSQARGEPRPKTPKTINSLFDEVHANAFDDLLCEGKGQQP
jgi:hypothetical protein